MDIIRFTLQTKEWGEVKIARPVSKQDSSWGCLESIKETPVGKLIPVVTGEVFSHALSGHITPLMRQIGPEPQYLLRQIPKDQRECKNIKVCITADKANCYPCKEMPDCYQPPKTPLEVEPWVTQVLLAWREGYYVIVIEGAGFSL
jgi:hypothetical protein